MGEVSLSALKLNIVMMWKQRGGTGCTGRDTRQDERWISALTGSALRIRQDQRSFCLVSFLVCFVLLRCFYIMSTYQLDQLSILLNIVL